MVISPTTLAAEHSCVISSSSPFLLLKIIEKDYAKSTSASEGVVFYEVLGFAYIGPKIMLFSRMCPAPVLKVLLLAVTVSVVAKPTATPGQTQPGE